MKIFIAEEGSEEMVSFFASVRHRDKVVSVLAALEARSAICRLQKGEYISSVQSESALASLMAVTRLVSEQMVTANVLAEAAGLIERRQLRALDALQLGTAIAVRQTLSHSEIRFIASDKALLEAASNEGFNVWDPAMA